MTEAQARAVLRNRVVKNVLDDPNEQPADSAGSLYVPFEVTDVVVDGIKGSTSLLFSKSTKRLVQVNLNATLGDAASDRHLKMRSLITELSKKYGKPVIDLSCDQYSCDGTWKSGGQAIELHTLADDMFMLFYTPIVKDL